MMCRIQILNKCQVIIDKYDCTNNRKHSILKFDKEVWRLFNRFWRCLRMRLRKSNKYLTPANTSELTREKLIELEQDSKSNIQKLLDLFISFLPLICCAIAIAEYVFIPNKLEKIPLFREK